MLSKLLSIDGTYGLARGTISPALRLIQSAAPLQDERYRSELPARFQRTCRFFDMFWQLAAIATRPPGATVSACPPGSKARRFGGNADESSAPMALPLKALEGYC